MLLCIVVSPYFVTLEDPVILCQRETVYWFNKCDHLHLTHVCIYIILKFILFVKHLFVYLLDHALSPLDESIFIS